MHVPGIETKKKGLNARVCARIFSRLWVYPCPRFFICDFSGDGAKASTLAGEESFQGGLRVVKALGELFALYWIDSVDWDWLIERLVVWRN